MRVFFLTNIPSPYRVDFFNELGKYCQLTVLYERKTASDRDKQWVADQDENYKAIFLDGKEIGADGAFSLKVMNWLKKDKFDVFVIGGYSTPTAMLAIQVLRLKKIPFFLNADGGFIKEDSKLKYAIKKHFISSASWWLSTGNATSDYLSHYGAVRENIYSYPFTSVFEKDILKESLDQQQKLVLRRKLGITGEKVAISVGQLTHRKGYDILIEVWEKINPNFQLLIIGSGQDKDKLKGLVQKKQMKNIIFVDFKPKDILKEYYLATDLFILPTREDIWGLVVNEAMGYGLPIITTDKCIAGLELIKDDINGYIIPIDNSEKWIEKIEIALADNSMTLKASQENLKKIRDYTIELMVKRHVEIFNSTNI